MRQNSVIMITGGTGSFGSTMAKVALAEGCREVRIFSRDELKQHEMRVAFADNRMKFILGDVRNYSSVAESMQGVDYVFHAAALKQVPSCEYFPEEAVLTNVFGSKNVIDAAIKNGVKSIVCLGTDKAVYPINAMGMTKALMEKIAVSSSRNCGPGATVVTCVRYGNVMYSRGSVIPHFIGQMKAGQDMTVTVPEMTRFMLSLRDAIDLVKYAMENGEQGQIFIRKAPACTVVDLAQALKELFNSPAKIRIIGVRHGEKMHETLANKEELIRSIDKGLYYVIQPDGRDLNYEQYFTQGDTREAGIQDYTSENTTRLNVEQTKELLMTLPEVRAQVERAGDGK